MFRKMALAAPVGILPPTSEILDMFLIVYKEFMHRRFPQPRCGDCVHCSNIEKSAELATLLREFFG